MVGLSPSVIANSFAVGAALLSLWIFIRFPNWGPQTFRSAGLVVFSACGLLFLAGPFTAATEALTGPVIALLAAFLPSLMFASWAALRLLCAMIVAAGGRFNA
jgi:hypothetical protein